MLFAVPLLLIGLCVGLLVRRWSVVIAVIAIGFMISVLGWQAAWFADEDTPALGGAIIFALIFLAPVALGIAIGTHAQSRSRSRAEDGSSLPIVHPDSREPSS